MINNRLQSGQPWTVNHWHAASKCHGPIESKAKVAISANVLIKAPLILLQPVYFDYLGRKEENYGNLL